MGITKWDEYLIHQAYETVDTGEVEDDRFLISCHSVDGTLHLTTGLGAYPNAGVMDGYVCVRHQGTQHNLRLSRRLQGDRADTVIGPLTVKVIEPLKRWGVYLSENDYGMGSSIEFEARSEPYLFSKAHPYLPFVHYTQAGRYSGSITLDKQVFDVDGFIGVRDRSWRARLGNLEQVKPFGGHMWIQVHFADFFLSLVGLYWWDDPDPMFNGAMVFDDGRIINVTNVFHRVEFVPDVRMVSKVKLLLKCADGEDRYLRAETKSPSLSLAGGGYDSHQGTDRGPYAIEGERWDVSQAADIGSVVFGPIGIRESIADFDLEGKPGTGILEASYSTDRERPYRPTLKD